MSSFQVASLIRVCQPAHAGHDTKYVIIFGIDVEGGQQDTSVGGGGLADVESVRHGISGDAAGLVGEGQSGVINAREVARA